MIKAILAVDSEFGIGKDNKLAWHHPEDLKYYKEQTTGDLIVMGNSTWRSLPPAVRPMPNRVNAVIAQEYDAEVHKGATYVITPNGLVINGFITEIKCESDYPNSVIVAQFLSIASHHQHNNQDTWVVGGASIYKLLMGFVEELHMTVVPGTHGCDTFYNPLEGVKPFTLQQSIPLVNKHGNRSLVVGVYGADPF